MEKIKFTFLPSYLLTFLLVIPVFGQQTLPSASLTFGNFKNIYTGIKHPSLSLNGFTEGGSKGNSLQEIITSLSLYQTQIASYNTTSGSLFDAKNPDTPNANGVVDKISNVETNAISLEKQAFMAMLTFALEKYQNNTNHGFNSFGDIAVLLKANLKKNHSWYVVNREIQGDKVDYVKWTQSMMNYARAIDLYLGLEILIRSHSNSSQFTSNLLTDSDKKSLMEKLRSVIGEGYEALYNDDKWYLDAAETVGFIDIDMKEIESGNRPLKMFLAIGYCAMAYQSNSSDISSTSFNYTLDGVLKSKQMQGMFLEALDVSDYRHKTNNRAHYYAYQTNGGEENWAEGPFYLEFALREILPFWHAIRINSSALPSPYNNIDPFTQSDFLNPIKWLTDLVMPDGRIPAVDDANFREFYKINYLNWSPAYVSNDRLTPARV